MNKEGPVIVIEDDDDDQLVIKLAYDELGYQNKLIFFSDGLKALEYLENPDVLPFLIISDINLPKLSGLELRTKLKNDADLSIKCIPYLFFTTFVDQKTVMEAYSLSAQGFFIKQMTLEEIKNTLSVIMQYWKICAAPNNF